MPECGRRIEQGIQPVRHAVGAYVSRDELALETQFALDRVGVRAAIEQSEVDAILDHGDLTLALTPGGDVGHERVGQCYNAIGVSIGLALDPFEQANRHVLSHGADRDNAFRP